MAKDAPQVPARARDQLQDQRTPGTYLPGSPNLGNMSNQEILSKVGSNQRFYQGQGFKGLDVGQAAEH
eukprot:3429930-Alexandrium_andersonii.AAC.1